MPEFEVKYLVRGIITVNVQADTLEQAVATAQRRWSRKSFFRDRKNILEERSEVCGVDNLDLWGKTSD